jgi:hypothetical protein
MVQCFGLGGLPPLRHPGPDLMTLIAGHLAVFRMTESNAKRLRKLRSSPVSAQLMTGAARGNVASAGLSLRGVAAKAGVVRIEPGGNR